MKMKDISSSTKIYRWLFLIISLSSWKKLADSKEVRIVCYYTNWSVYRPGTAKFSPQNINPYLCTHLVYAFGGFTKENTLKPFDKYQDIEKGGYAKFTGLKTYNKNLKTLIAIGGWNEGSSRFSPMVASAERRKELVKNTIKFLRKNHFDGLDLDWEYPTFRDGGKARDRDNYAQLVKELREEFDRESEKTGRPRLLLTMAVPAGIEYIKKGYDIPKLMKYLDWMNILSYDYHSAFEPAVDHHAPLYSLEEDSEYNYDTELNIDYTIKHYLENGAIPDKLVLGIPTYGRSYTLFNPEANEIGAPADGPGDMGEATRENGYLAYYEICDNVKNQGWEVVRPDENAMGPYAFKENQWVGYDDENIVRKKAEYVAKNDLGGIMFWAIDNDDFRGNCHGRPYPLIEAGKEALLTAYGMTDENLIAPPSKPTKTKTKSRTRNHKTTTTEAPEETSVATKSPTRRRRIKTKQKEEDKIIPASSSKRRKIEKGETSTYSSLKIVTPSWTTPPPPATPDMGGAFKCEDEGFFPHPKDCKKYFWCLAGAGDSGIVAHQFTCPAGLYFNKAADSCDYTQNVLCNKKLQKATTTTTTESSSTSSSTSSTSPRSSILSGLFSSTRVPPKITAATSKTTFVARTTTEAIEEEYDEDEYEDDETDDKKSSEEDPRVIKELIELIRKAGGIEQLERHLKIGDRGSESTTPSALSKTLYEKVLSKASPSTLNTLRRGTGTTRNSAGPQNQGIEKSKSNERGKIQYQNISRRRPSTEKSTDDEVKNEYVSENKAAKKNSTPNKNNNLEYVSIRRPKSGTSTTESSDDESDSSRNKILGESSDELDDVDGEKTVENTRKSNTLPQYVNIRRQRPSTTESGVVEEKDGSTTLRYVSIRRSTTPSSADEAQEPETSDKQMNGSLINPGLTNDENFKTTRYQTLSRTSTTTPSSYEENIESVESKRSTSKPELAVNSDSKYQVIHRSTTTTISPNPEENDISEQNIITKLDDENISSSSTEQQPASSSTSASINRKIEEKTNLEGNPVSNKDTKRPSLFKPRPFSTVAGSTTTQSTSDVTKKESTLTTLTPRPLFLVGARRRNSTLYFTTASPRSSSSTIQTINTDIYEENSKKINKNPYFTRRPIKKNNVLYASRTTLGTRFSGTTVTTARPSATRVTKYSRRKVNSGTTKPVESQVLTTVPTPRINSRFKFVSRRPYTRTQPQKKANESLNLNTDQSIEPSNQQSMEEEIRNSLETNDFKDVAHTLQNLQKAPKPSTRRQPQKTRTTVSYTSNYSSSSSRRTIRPTTPQAVSINIENNPITENPTSPRIEVSTFRRTIKPKLTFKQTPTYQEVLISQEEENESTTESQRQLLRYEQPLLSLTPSSNFTELKNPLYHKDSTNLRNKEPGTEHFIESTGFSQGSTSKPNLIFNEVPIIIPVISSSYLKKSNSKNPQNNNDYTQFVYQNTNLGGLDFSPVTPVPSNHRGTYNDDTLGKLSIGFPSAGFLRGTTAKTIPDLTPSEGDTVTAVPFYREEDREMTHAHVESYSTPNIKPIKSRHQYSTTQPPFVIVTPTLTKEKILRKKGRPIQAFDKLFQPAEANTFKPLAEYDYYDDLEASILEEDNEMFSGNVPEHGKVLLHSNGEIECLDQGNFPHPVSCKKFISCAKVENGRVYGWEYTCPKNLSFDPIGGMCNWSAGLGCNEN